MTKVSVIGVALDDPALQQLLDATECEIVEAADEGEEPQPETVDEEDDAAAALAANDDCDDELVIIVLTPECAADADLAAVVRDAVARGRRVIGMWPPGIDGGAVPPCIEQMGDDVIVWQAEPLRRVIRGEKPQWQTPTGEARPEPKTKRNCC
jgi:hypothetical protein